VLLNTSLNVCFAHTMSDLHQVVNAHHESLRLVERNAA
jgi:hypothetical protein